ncbi:hypothetical protein [Pseudoalteromonas sp. S1688]|uniref:hypothetical protein n=1 Tax=Pseudoalteromonas sp. S1688 TaxID=579511 RepID=UPI00110ADBEA|nr:hypothetical protein [Pseudoalteromonas sp. S1688]TMP50215.1 hypothetical protein CWB81_11325 [Pseudoalteromonas sp. S1688]
MSINIKSLILEAMEEALRVAKHQTEKQRPIENLNPRCIANQFLKEKMVGMADTDNRTLYLLTALIESDDSLGETLELDEIVKSVKNGCVLGFDANDSGRYSFDVYTHIQTLKGD